MVIDTKGIRQRGDSTYLVDITVKGVRQTRTVKGTIDDAKLASAVQKTSELGKGFSTADTGLAVGFKALADGMLGTDGALTTRSEGLRSSIKRNEKDQERIEDRIARTRERLLRQYSALDNTVNQLTGLSNLVTQQLDMLKNSFNYNNDN